MKVQPGEARFGRELDWEKPWRDQVDERDKWKQTSFFLLGVGSFWTRIRWGKAVAAAGVRGQGAREKWKKTIAGVARFGPELAWEKPWRHQVFGARKKTIAGVARPGEARFGFGLESKWFILIGIQRQCLAAKVRPGEGSFWIRIRF